MKTVHGLKVRALKLSLILLVFFSIGIEAKTLKVDTITPSITNGDLVLLPNGSGDIKIGTASGFLKLVSGIVTPQEFIDLTSDITGILPIANGGTGSATQNFVDLTTAQVIAGVKTLTSPVINTSISGTAILDEDDLISDSSTQLATQQSIKKYVDDNTGAAPSFTTVTKTATATLLIVGEDNIVVDATSADFTITLPTASGNNGITYNIYKSTEANTVTIDADGSETIGGELTLLMPSEEDSITISSDGTNWSLDNYNVLVYAKYNSNAGQGNNNGVLVLLNFEDLVRDTHGAVTIGSGWIFDAPIDGVYCITAKVKYSIVAGRMVQDDTATLAIYLGGVFIDEIFSFEAIASPANAQSLSMQGSTCLFMDKGETVNARAQHTFTTGSAYFPDSKVNHITIRRQ